MSFSYINTFNNASLLDFADEAYKYVNNGKPLASSIPECLLKNLQPVIIGYATSFLAEAAQNVQKRAGAEMSPELAAFFADLILHNDINMRVGHYLRTNDAGHLITFETMSKGFQEKARAVRFLALHNLPLPQAKIAKLAELFPNVTEISLGITDQKLAKPAAACLNELAKFPRLAQVTLIACAGITRADLTGIARGRRFRCMAHRQDPACALRHA